MSSHDVIINEIKRKQKAISELRAHREAKLANKIHDQKSWQAWQDDLNVLTGQQIGLQQAIQILEKYNDIPNE